MSKEPGLRAIPVVALTNAAEENRANENRATGFADCLTKFDRTAMLRSLDRLAAAVEREERVGLLHG